MPLQCLLTPAFPYPLSLIPLPPIRSLAQRRPASAPFSLK
ncbi:hypothetical protein E2C01_052762 [Portunus trituberculatus]|uniref:Uncharacterized protein n=1 Tax=Portunus trituberculatus TaxID=210409 RepID=A0A5B7GML1_PORTR|nr:hypothetical protein [Portunus trituberculatus]